MDRPREGTAASPEDHPGTDLIKLMNTEVEAITSNTYKQHELSKDQELAIIADEKRDWTTTPLFFYGSLREPKVLSKILGLKSLPIMQPASVMGFKIKMWGPYPTAVPSEGSQVKGNVWMCDSREHYNLLQAYETNHYRHEKCEVKTEEGKFIENCSIFIWSGGQDDPILKDGSFDLKKFMAESGHSKDGY